MRLHSLKFRSFGAWTILLGLSLPVWAAEQPGAISGYVRSNAGTPQMGAVVQILGAANHSLTVFTNGAGYYTANGLIPGFYSLKVTAPSFLPALREKVGLRPGASLNINVTLSTLLGVMQLGPIRPVQDDDDWKWTLRSVANRPILRAVDDPISNGVADPAEKQSHSLSGTLSFLAGSTAGGDGTGSDMNTGFTVERSIYSEGQLAFSGEIGYSGNTVPAGVLRTTYSNRLDDGSAPTLGVTVRRFSPTDPNLHGAALQALTLSAGDDFTVADVVELKFGSELQTVQFLGHASAFRPYGSARLQLAPSTVLEYDYATSRPDPREEKGFDSSPADFSESNPRISLLNFVPQIESAHHNEVSLSRRVGKNKIQVAAYSDRVDNPALLGTGSPSTVGGFLLPDVSSGTFTYGGKTIDTSGLRFALQRKFSNDLTGTIDCAYGGVLNLSQPDVSLQQAQQYLTTQRRRTVAAKLSGTTARTHTRWIASYRWVNGPALTPVDMYNASIGQSEPFLNIFIRQPIPSLGGHVEAIIDVRNLLAQGYIPVLAQDGQTVYLVQTARSVRGGVSFSF